MANDGYEFAIDYVEYIESAEAEDDEAKRVDSTKLELYNEQRGKEF